MFSWFLKLLGIDEDRPAASNNSLLNTPSSQAAAPAAKKPEPEPKPEPAAVPKIAERVAEKVKEEPVAAKPAAKKKKAEAKPEQQAKTKAKKTAAKSLADVFPGLKANFVKVLTEAGFDSKKAIKKATDKELLALKGIGQATIKILRN